MKRKAFLVAVVHVCREDERSGGQSLEVLLLGRVLQKGIDFPCQVERRDLVGVAPILPNEAPFRVVKVVAVCWLGVQNFGDRVCVCVSSALSCQNQQYTKILAGQTRAFNLVERPALENRRQQRQVRKTLDLKRVLRPFRELRQLRVGGPDCQVKVLDEVCPRLTCFSGCADTAASEAQAYHGRHASCLSQA